MDTRYHKNKNKENIANDHVKHEPSYTSMANILTMNIDNFKIIGRLQEIIRTHSRAFG